MQNYKHVVIIAGEESGDKHAARFVEELKSRHPHLKLTGIGGHHMQQAGVELISDLARFAVTGTSEIIRHFRTLKRAFNQMQQHLKTHRPDLLILVDYPGFNLRMAKYAKRVLGLKIIYYISPQIWAWKASRIHLIRECVDKMAVILPFEKAIYEKGQVPVSYVGHPLVEDVVICDDVEQQRQALNLPQHKRIVAMLPGSRRNEIEHHMPVLAKSAARLCQQHNDLHIVIPVAESLNPDTIDAYCRRYDFPYTLYHGKAREVVSVSDCAVVASGTASLECALLEKPMCIIYKGSVLSYILAFIFIKVRYLGLCNLLQNEMIAPELLQYDCNVEELSKMIDNLLTNEHTRSRMIKRLQQLKYTLSSHNADTSITHLIEHELGTC